MAKARASARARAKVEGDGAPELGNGSLRLGAHSLPLHAGAVHYFRLKPSAWRAALESLRDLGLGIVETYVPWGVHEREGGLCDFGEHDPHKDLGAFLDLAHELGLYVFVRPGPNINAELTYFGLPARVVFDPACQARSPRGNPVPLIAPPKMFPVPSYASERFFAETDRWFAEVAKVVAPRVWPNGPVVLIQVDNEASFYFRDAPFDQDYHPDALAMYRRRLEAQYGSLAELNAAHGTEWSAWEDVAAPERFEGHSHAALRRSLSWIELQESLLHGALARMRESLARVGLGRLPTVHNLAMGEGGFPGGIADLERALDCVGLDYYHRRGDLRTVKERTLRLAGTSRLPFAPEFGAGAPPYFPPRTDADSIAALMTACAFGLRGFNLYMAVDRDRWYGAPIDEDGRPRESAQMYARFVAALERTGFSRLRRHASVGLMLPREYARLSRATHLLGALSPSLLDLAGAMPTAACLQDDLGFSTSIQTAWLPFLQSFARALTRAGIPYVWIDDDVDPARLSELRAVVTPTYTFASRARFRRLRTFAERGGVVVYGPLLPSLDEALKPFDFVAPEHARKIAGVGDAGVDACVDALVHELALVPTFSTTSHDIECTVHEDESGPSVLFLVHFTAQAQMAEVELPEPMTLVDALTGERFVGSESVRIPMPGTSCRMFTCERPSNAPRREKLPSAKRSEPPC